MKIENPNNLSLNDYQNILTENQIQSKINNFLGMKTVLFNYKNLLYQIKVRKNKPTQLVPQAPKMVRIIAILVGAVLIACFLIFVGIIGGIIGGAIIGAMIALPAVIVDEIYKGKHKQEVLEVKEMLNAASSSIDQIGKD